MSKNTKIVLGVLAVIVIVGLVWFWVAGNANNGGNSAVTTTVPAGTNNATTSMNDNSQPTSSSGVVPGNSDQSINQEMSNINAQMNGLSSDSASIDQGLNDQPVQQGQ